MADQLDNRPVFTVVMGCNGAGKSAWKRLHYDVLPTVYFDQDSIAGGIGDWNGEDARLRTRQYVDREIERCFEERLCFGIESTFSGRPEPEIVKRAMREGYRIEGLYLGTEQPECNIRRIQRRVDQGTGHSVDSKLVPERYKWSLSNLRRNVECFDQLELVDNSKEDELGMPQPIEQCVLEKGKVVSKQEQLADWCRSWLDAVEQAKASQNRLDAKQKRA